MAIAPLSREDLQYHTVDVLVVGSGAAGLRAALAAQEQGADVLVVGKRPRSDPHTVLAAGGINAALGTMDPEDSWIIHAADTLYEGRMIGNADAVDLLCREAPQAIEELVRYGAEFARGSDGQLLQRYFGAHRYRRTCFAGDHTGRVMMVALLAEADRRHIAVVDDCYISDLLTDDERVTGALGFRLDGGDFVAYQAGAVILATGGTTSLYPRTSSRRWENTGDGMALALRAGAPLTSMEMVQFHPTGMVWPEEAAGTLVTEAVRGEGGRLYNAKSERYMVRYDAERMELSTRDRIALANYREILAGRGTERGGIWLDISHVPAATIRERLPRMVDQFARQGIDITREPMEVAPTAHYAMGGIRVAPSSHATSLPGLFAAGEVTGDIHGANRLGGNSLTDCIVFGRKAGDAACRYAGANRGAPLNRDEVSAKQARAAALGGSDPKGALGLIAELHQMMWQHAGLVRDADGLTAAIEAVGELRERQRELPAAEAEPRALATALDADFMLLSAEATVRAALLRTESRGAHQRRDYPETDPAWQRAIVIVQRAEGLELTTEALPELSPEVAAALPDERDITVAGRLLE